jgi:hypothetical protein
LILIRRRSRKIAANSHPSARTLGWLTFPPRPHQPEFRHRRPRHVAHAGAVFLVPKSSNDLPRSSRVQTPAFPHVWGLFLSRSSGLVLRFALRQDSLGRLGCSSVIRLPQSFACQRSLVEVRPAIPVCILVGSVGLCVQAGLRGASDPWRSSAAIRILRGSVVVQTSLVPSREYTLQTVRFRVSDTATMRAKPGRDGQKGHGRRAARLIIDVDHGGPLWPSDKEVCPPCYSPAPKR